MHHTFNGFVVFMKATISREPRYLYYNDKQSCFSFKNNINEASFFETFEESLTAANAAKASSMNAEIATLTVLPIKIEPLKIKPDNHLYDYLTESEKINASIRNLLHEEKTHGSIIKNTIDE